MSLRRLFFFMDIIEFLKRSYLGDKRRCSNPVREIFPFRFACSIAVQLIICPTPKSNTPKDKAFRPRIILPRKSDASSPLASDTMKSLSIPSRKDHRYSAELDPYFLRKQNSLSGCVTIQATNQQENSMLSSRYEKGVGDEKQIYDRNSSRSRFVCHFHDDGKPAGVCR